MSSTGLQTSLTSAFREYAASKLRFFLAPSQAAAWIAASLICVAYVAYFLMQRELPLQDIPNHLARGAIIADLLFHHGAQFGQTYTLSLLPIPYSLHDLLLATLVAALGVQAGGAVFCVVTLLSLPLALLFYLRVTGLAPRAGPLVLLLGLYLGTDFFFFMAFMAFRLAIAILIVSLALVESLRRQWNRRTYLAYILSVLVGYLTHLTAPTFLAIALAVSGLLRLVYKETTPRRELVLWLPLVLLAVMHFGFVHLADLPASQAAFGTHWDTWQHKLQQIWLEFSRYNSRLELPMRTLFIACLLWPLWRISTWSSLRRSAILEPLLMAVVFLAFYVASPRTISMSTYVDVRALPVITLMLLLACLNLPLPSRAGKEFATASVLAMGLVLALTNLVYIEHHVNKNEAFVDRYRSLGAAIPPGSYVLPVQTLPRDGRIRPLLHVAAYLVTDRGITIPYLFSGNHGDSMIYFRYRDMPYRPEEEWYFQQVKWNGSPERTYWIQGHPYTWHFTKQDDAPEPEPLDLNPVDWNQVACQYDYLITTQPANLSLIEVPIRHVMSNDVASLFAVDKSACHDKSMITRSARARPQFLN